MNSVLKLVAISTFLLSQSIYAGEIEVEHYAVSADLRLPFSEAVRVGHMLYLSGQLGFDSKTSSYLFKFCRFLSK